MATILRSRFRNAVRRELRFLARTIRLVPALVASVRIVTTWDLVSLKLGEAPERTIPLFDGLTRTEARVAILMGKIRTAEAGARVLARGEKAEEMFILLSGRGEVRLPGRSGSVTIRTVERGEVIGEMGLLRGQPRSADVVALAPLELLCVDQTFLDSLRRRYPRIAATILRNLSRSLSDRLQSVSELVLAGAREARRAS